jgi:hypothetical protein
MKKARRREFLKTVGAAAVGASCLAGSIGRLRAQEKPDLANEGKEFKPGETVRTSGIYDVLHDRLDGDTHADRHQVTAIVGTIFPRCRGCREWVRFRLYQAAEHIATDPHFEA